MTNINRLTSQDQLSAADLLPVWGSQSSDTKRITAQTLGTFVAGLVTPQVAQDAAGIAADIVETDLGQSSGSSLVGFVQSGTGAVARSMQAKAREVVSVKDFGAKGDGSTNDTAAIQKADTYARSIAAQLYFPAGTYMVSQLVVYTGSNWRGDGRNATTIKQIIGSNTDLLYGNNSNDNWGRTDANRPTLIVNGWMLFSLTLDGNWNAGAGNTAGSGIAVYGCRPIMRDVFITNCADYGMRTEYIDTDAGGFDAWGMEGHFENIRVDTVGKHGWLNAGPHDSVTLDLIVVDAGQAATNTWDGIVLAGGSSGKLVSCHVWNRSWAARHRYALRCDENSSHEFTAGCHFEGSYSAVAAILGSGNMFDSTTRFYAAWNGLTIFLGGTCTRNNIQGALGAPGPGRPETVGVQFGTSGADFISINTIDLDMAGQNVALFHFGFSSGDNNIRARSYQTAGNTYTGTPALSDILDIQNTGNANAMDKAPVRPIAWCTFQVAAGVVTLNSNYNVASVTRSATGQFRVNFGGDVKANVLGVAISSDFGPGPSALIGVRPTGNAAGYQDIHFRKAADGTYADPVMATVLLFQD